MDVKLFIGPVDPDTGCQLWFGPAPQRRPIIRCGKQTFSATRLRYELAHGPISKSQVVVQTCGNPMCMALDHLIVKSRSDVAKRS